MLQLHVSHVSGMKLQSRYLSTGVFSAAAAAGDPGPCSVEEFPSAAVRLLFFPAPHVVLFRASDDPHTGAMVDCV